MRSIRMRMLLFAGVAFGVAIAVALLRDARDAATTPNGVGAALSDPALQAAARTYCSALFAHDPALQERCIVEQGRSVPQLTRIEAEPIDRRIVEFCARMFGDDENVRRVCYRDQSAVIERLRQHNSGPAPELPD
jgi:hypothetical protein